MEQPWPWLVKQACGRQPFVACAQNQLPSLQASLGHNTAYSRRTPQLHCGHDQVATFIRLCFQALPACRGYKLHSFPADNAMRTILYDVCCLQPASLKQEPAKLNVPADADTCSAGEFGKSVLATEHRCFFGTCK